MYPSQREPGYGIFVKNVVDGLLAIDKNLEVDFVVISGSGHGVVSKLWKYIVFYCRIMYHLLCFRYDLVYVHYITHATPVLRWLAIFKAIPLVYNVHGRDLITQSSLTRYLLKLSIPLLMKARLIILPSYFFKRKIKELIPEMDEEKLFVSPSGGINTNVFNDRNQHDKCIGFVSRVELNKGIDTFLEALFLLKKRGCAVESIIVGGCANKENFLQQISRLSLNDNVHYVGGVRQEELADYYNKMDVFVFPTKYEESLGLVGLEAMACGTPVIGSYLGGLTDYIVDGKNGFFFEVGNAVALADTLMKYIGLSESEKSTMRKNATLTSNKYANTKVVKCLYDRFLAL